MQAEKPSITAENVAAVRAFEAMRPPHERICNDAYAHLFLSERFAGSPDPAEALSRTLAKWEIAVPGVCGSIIARTRFIDDCLAGALENRLEQLVILGAGYDTRALRFQVSTDKIKVFEIDHPSTQAFKLKLLKKCTAAPEKHVMYLAVDFEEQDFGDVLLAHGYDRSLYTFFIWEGISYYLSAQVVDHTLSFIARNAAPGSEIAFDYFPASITQGACELPEAQPLSQTLHQLGENILFGISPPKLTGFLGQRGFRIIQSLTSQDYQEAYFKAKGCQGRRVSKLFNFAHAAVV